ncbi:hypothetical protein [Teredinibacter waterburyi]|uniref:hypothetical protein n=1 Tax=Teredinibacter waterburyi TaxID=1500538 RepID=UPI00165F0046|nr:hypothetical protein [Teredinibacter waterburyi]
MKKGNIFHDFVIIIFFSINSIFLPFGLYFSHIFSLISFFYIVKWSKGSLFFLLVIIVLFILYSFPVLMNNNVRISDYIVGFTILFLSIVFSVYIYLYIAYRLNDFHTLISIIIKINFSISVISSILFIFGQGTSLWTDSGSYGVNRLQLFFYEPSIYSLVSSIFVIYAVTNFLKLKNKESFYLLMLSIFPLFLSKSFGVMSAIALSIILGDIKNIAISLSSFKTWALGLILILTLIFMADSLIERFESALQGQDNSGMVRVVYSLLSAIELVKDEGVLLGVGPGQLKYVIGKYTAEHVGFGASERLPNSVASTIATVGILGFSLKLIILIGLFYFTRSYKFSYSRCIFIFIFIYQFTGGYFNNLNEFVPIAFSFGYAKYLQRKNGCLYRVVRYENNS